MRILVAEDNPELLDLIVTVLQRDGHEVTAVTQGRDAQREIDTAGYAACVLDIVMPEVDGLELVRLCAALDPKPKVIVISGDGLAGRSDIYLKAANVMGADAVLKKPFAPNDLLAALAAVTAESA